MVRPMSRARMISPKFPPGSESAPKCVRFVFHTFGGDIGQLSITDQDHRAYYEVRGSKWFFIILW